MPDDSSVDEYNPFERAIQVLDEYGWTQGDMQSLSGKVCVLGALCVAVHGKPTFVLSPAIRFFEKYTQAQYDSYPEMFNDAQGRTLGEIKRILTEASQLWKAENHDK